MTTSSRKEPVTANQNNQSGTATSWLQVAGRWNMEVTSLYAKRMQYWYTMPMRLMQCRSPGDLTEAQDEFSQTLLADYRTAAEKLAMAMNAGVGENSEVSGEGYASALLKAQEDAGKILDQARAQAKRIVEEAQAKSKELQAKDEKVRAA